MQLAKNVVDFLNILHFSEHSESKDFLNVCALMEVVFIAS